DFADIELFVQAQRVEDALRRRSCTEALQWCSEHKSALRKNKSALEFQLRLQEYVELVRARKLVDAIAYAKKYLVSWADAHMKEIQTAMGLLAFSPDTSCKPYMVRRHGRGQFRADNYALNSLPNQPLLTLTLQAGLSALKTQQCYQPANQNFNCPVCATDTLGVLALHLPLSHHVNSNIVCRISGQIMNEDNPPMALPNGMVYSHKVGVTFFLCVCGPERSSGSWVGGGAEGEVGWGKGRGGGESRREKER
ncbi:MAG: CTLH/CRA C-terminal to lish motif domain-containing protein, partial [Olpidium bornovanus]